MDAKLTLVGQYGDGMKIRPYPGLTIESQWQLEQWYKIGIIELGMMQVGILPCWVRSGKQAWPEDLSK